MVPYSSTLKMGTSYSSETSIGFQRNTWHCIPEDTTLHWLVYLNWNRIVWTYEKKYSACVRENTNEKTVGASQYWKYSAEKFYYEGSLEVLDVHHLFRGWTVEELETESRFNVFVKSPFGYLRKWTNELNLQVMTFFLSQKYYHGR
jgi:hypothetical protein